jgi:hypothetical protein
MVSTPIHCEEEQANIVKGCVKGREGERSRKGAVGPSVGTGIDEILQRRLRLW